MNRRQILSAFKNRDISLTDLLAKLGQRKKNAYSCELSEGQRGLWLLQQMEPASSGYNLPCCLKVDGQLDPQIVTEALNILAQEHPLLTCNIQQDKNGQLKACQQSSSIALETEDLSHLSQDAVLSTLQQRAKIPFDLKRDALIRSTLFSTGARSHLLLLVMHHIVMDAQSMQLVIDRLIELCVQLEKANSSQSESVTAQPPTSHYGEFVAWEKAMMQSDAGQKHLAYWQQQLQGPLPVLKLPTDKKRGKSAGKLAEVIKKEAVREESAGGRIVSKSIPNHIYQGIGKATKAFNVAPAVFMLGAYQLLLSRWSGEQDVIVGMPSIGRPEEKFEDLVGYFVNMVPIRSQVKPEQPLGEYLKRLQLTLVDGLDHAVFPFPALVRELKVQRKGGSAPIFQVAFEFQSASVLNNLPAEPVAFGDATIEITDDLHQVGEFELTLEIYEQTAGFELHFKYDSALFDSKTIERMAGQYIQLLTDMFLSAEKPLSAYNMLAPEERQHLLSCDQHSQQAYPKEQCFHQLFSAQAEATPDAIALQTTNGSLTYRELNTRANDIASLLRDRGIAPGKKVGVYLDRTENLLISLMAIMKTGAAYIPLDPMNPADRLQWILQNSGLQLVLTTSSHQAQLHSIVAQIEQQSGVANTAIGIFNLDENTQASATNTFASWRTSNDARPEDVAYVIYTSGSTGRPKGVEVQHQALVNFLCAMANTPGMSANETLLAVTTYSFDISGLELFLPLLVGGCCYLCSTDEVKNIEKLQARITAVKPHIMQATPVMWTSLFQLGWKNQERVKMLCGGEPLSEALQKHISDTDSECWNMYGPTETTIWSTVSKVSDEQVINIGKPIANTQVYVLDPELKLQPSYVTGELYIGGDGVAKGYLNQPQLTDERFINHPFKPDGKIYKTGDLAFRQSNDALVCLGRTDNQVKIRGYRIELGEIENQLAQHPGIAECAVITTADSDPQLVAFYTPQSAFASQQGPLNYKQLRNHAASQLPDYMIPVRFHALPEFPLTSSGKVDRNQLRAQEQSLSNQFAGETQEPSVDIIQTIPTALEHFELFSKSTGPMAKAAKLKNVPTATSESVSVSVSTSASNSAPTSASTPTSRPVELELTTLWRQLLKHDEIGLDDSFIEVGGDSVLALTLAQKVQEVFDCAFTVTEVFEHGTIRGMAQQLMARTTLSSVDENAAPVTQTDSAVEASIIPANKNDIPVETAVTNNSGPEYYKDSLAIIGMSGQFPGANNIDEFWQNLVQGVESVVRFSSQELDDNEVASRFTDAENFVASAAFVDGRDLFDAGFFKYAPKDAKLMDPQVRLLLQHAWNAVEDAGYVAEDIQDAAVFVATSNSAYPALFNKIPVAAPWSVISDNYQYISWMMSQGGTIPTLISNKLNLRGPSFAVHSNCSSSLVGLYAAQQAIRGGECNHALVGAATVFASQSYGYIHQKGMNFSGDGHVKTFDAAADGMVGGEGAAVLMLKRADLAVQDNDAIYALLREVALNNDGSEKAGFYSPSIRGQQEVIEKAMSKADIHPRSIGYVEAHGTGTSLGDPIEFAALLKSYRAQTSDQSFCGLGSVKSNIGHADTAAGLAGCIKVALSLENNTIPPTLNYQQINPEIPLANSPFYIADKPSAYENAQGNRAALSSFGIGGTNGHTILEQAPVRVETAVTAGQQIIVLSAKKLDRLKERVAALKGFLQNQTSAQQQDENALLASVAYTLQTGRQAMSHRVAFVAQTANQLLSAMSVFIEAEKSDLSQDTHPFAYGQVSEGQLLQGADANHDIVANHQPDELANAWTRGRSVNWKQFYSATPGRVHLPGYPFAKERYWPESQAVESQSGVAQVTASEVPEKIQESDRAAKLSVLHPVLHKNTSTVFESCFSSEFSGEEFFLDDHQVNGAKVLPGVVYLEMVREAVKQSFALEDADDSPMVCLKDVAWLRPVIVDKENVSLKIAIIPVSETEFEYVVSSLVEAPSAIIHSQGKGSIVSKNTGDTVIDPSSINLTSLQSLCARQPINTEQLYGNFQSVGFNYGPHFQSVLQLGVGKDQQQQPQVLAKLRIPQLDSANKDAFSLHPSIMDAALQAAVGLAFVAEDDNSEPVTTLPFALSALNIYAKTPETCWAWVRYSEGSQAGGDIEKLDIVIADEQGNICVELHGFTSRVLKETATEGERLLYREQWQQHDLPAGLPAYDGNRLVLMVGETTGNLASALGAGVGLEPLSPQGASADAQFESLSSQIFRQIKGKFEAGLSEPLLIQCVTQAETNQTETNQADTNQIDASECYRGVSGLLKSAAMEHQRLLVQHIDVQKGLDAGSLSQLLQSNANSISDQDIRYRNGQREVLAYTAQQPPENAASWPSKGVYLITGGAGGLGRLLASEIGALGGGVSLVLTGRSPLNDAISNTLSELQSSGAKAEYRQVDVSDAPAVNNLVRDIVAQQGELSVVLHCAGLLADNFIQKKDSQEFSRVLAPKVAGLVNLDEATKNLALLHFVCFSSISALGSAGQSDYAAANGFMDSYMGYRSRLQQQGQRQGQSMSINWPLWAEGGMGVDDAVLAQLRTAGMLPLASQSGLKALRESLSLGESQGLSGLLVFSGDASRIESGLLTSHQRLPEVVAPVTEAAQLTSADGQSLQEKVEKMLIQQVSGLLEISRDNIDLDTELSDYGFDSISLTEFGNQLTNDYDIGITPTIFFEYPTLGDFTEYLLQSHSDVLSKAFNMVMAEVSASVPSNSSDEAPAAQPDTFTSIPPAPAVSTAAQSEPGQISAFKLRQSTVPSTGGLESSVMPTAQSANEGQALTVVREDVAIIGISGAFPGAPDLDTFWEVLSQGQDCISEIPQARWDWQDLYGDPHKEANKCNIKWGGFIDDVDKFDPLFFGIAPREALSMDPQQRLLMTHVWQAIEDAGYAPSSLSGSNTAVLLGTAGSGYHQLAAQADIEIEGYTATGMVPSLGPNRISYMLNLHGPSEPIETACSSALVAIHRALGCLYNGDSDLAIAGGANSIVSPADHISFNKAGMLSFDGRCKTFSAQANGYVRGEGVGIVVLKRLSAAQRDRDHIYGVLLGSAENHGGRANSLTAPNVKAQSALLVKAYEQAGIDPRSVGYIEAHGTGTSLGDPVEINALKDAFSRLYDKSQTHGKQLEGRCALGSVKTNIGHLELAAGIAGVIKVLLQFKHGQLVKSLHSDEINPYIKLDNSPFYVVQEAQAWPTFADETGKPLPRRAGVSSFGFGGVNAHVVLEEYPQTEHVKVRLPIHAVVLSAKSQAQLKAQVERLSAWITSSQPVDEDLADLAYTLQVGRDAMEHRVAFTVSDINTLKSQLQAFIEGEQGDWYLGKVKREHDEVSLFNHDEELKDAVKKWIQKGKISKLMELWVKGLVFDWEQLYPESKPHRLSLPTYPFAKTSYWAGPKANIEPSVASEPSANKEHSATTQPQTLSSTTTQSKDTVSFVDDNWLLLEEQWQLQPLSDISISSPAQKVLVLYRDPADQQKFQQALKRKWGEQANKLLINGILLPDAAPENESVITRHLKQHPSVDAVFYFSGRSFNEAGPEVELHWVLHIAQALINNAAQKATQFYYCYAQSQDNNVEDVTSLYQEGLSGLFRAVAMECPAHNYRTIEYGENTPASFDSILQEWLYFDKLLAEGIDIVPGQLEMVRYRSGERFVTELVEKPEQLKHTEVTGFREGATYLVVGGLGEVGQLVCQELARQYRPKLVMLSRRPQDEGINSQLAALQQAGADVLYYSVDITDRTALEQVFSQLRSDAGPIHGVLHLARQVQDGMIQNKSFDSFSQTIAAKVQGTLNIDALTASEPLEFFLSFSSMAAFGIEGSSDYCYATGFQNSFTRKRNELVARGERQGHSMALCWGQWMVDSYSDPERDRMLERMGFAFIHETSALPLMRVGLQSRMDVMGVIAVRNKPQIRHLYGLHISPASQEESLPDDLPESTAGDLANGTAANGSANKSITRNNGLLTTPSTLRKMSKELHSREDINASQRSTYQQVVEDFDAIEAMLRESSYEELQEIYNMLIQ